MKDEFKKDELLSISELDTNITKWKKFKQYKPASDEYSIDCDVVNWLFIYMKAWRFLDERKVNASRPTKQYTEEPYYYVRKYKYQLIINHDKEKEYYRGDIMTSFVTTYSHYKKHFESNENIKEQTEKFVKLYHTIGNMIPIPSYFNSERSGKGARYDFWNLTMQQIKKWYKNSKDESLKQLLNPDRDNTKEQISIAHCKKWLSHFTGWNDFVEQNHFQNFIQLVDGDEILKDEDGCYIPMTFWTNHSFESVTLPTKPDVFYKYLSVLNDAIEKRNEKILIELYRDLKVKLN
jgi:hypothetical protein